MRLSAFRFEPIFDRIPENQSVTPKLVAFLNDILDRTVEVVGHNHVPELSRGNTIRVEYHELTFLGELKIYAQFLKKQCQHQTGLKLIIC